MTINGIYHGLHFQQNDGGRLDAGFKGHTGDCGARSIAIATGRSYRDIYSHLGALQSEMTGGMDRSPRNGVGIPVFHRYLIDRGWQHYRTDGEYLTADSIPPARVVVCVLPRHFVTVIDCTVCDTWDSRRSTRTKNGAQRMLGFYVDGGL